MPEIDASIIGGLKPPQFDPLATVKSAVGLGTGLLENKLLNQQVQSKIALGKAVTGATDPSTGETNWNGALGTLSQDPNGAFAVPDLAKQVIERKLQSLNLSKGELELSAQRWGKVGDWAGALLGAKGPDGQPAALDPNSVAQSAAQNLIGSGMFPDQASRAPLITFLQGLQGQDAPGIRQKLQQLSMMSNFTAERIGSVLGTPAVLNTGSQNITRQVSPLTGQTTVDNVTDVTRSPSEKATMVQVWDPAKQAYVLKPSGALVGDMAPGALPGSGGAAQTQPQAAPALGEPEHATQMTALSTQLTQEAAKAPEVGAALKNIRDQTGNFAPGAKTDWIYAAKSMATQLGVASPEMKSQVAAQEEFNKLATQFINQQIGALGGTGTDQKLESARHATPNEFMTKQGIQNVTSLMLGLNDGLSAKNEAWQHWLAAGNPQGSFDKFQAQWNSLYNPRVFQSVWMDDAQRQAMLKGMAPADRDQFQKDWIFAKKAGWIK